MRWLNNLEMKQNKRIWTRRIPKVEKRILVKIISKIVIIFCTEAACMVIIVIMYTMKKKEEN